MNIRIIKIAECGKLTTPDVNSLTYNIGVDDSNNLFFRITDNTTGGLFSSEWLALDAILDTIEKTTVEKPFSSVIFDGLFTYRSANNAGFHVAALLAENVLQRHEKTKRLVKLGKPEKFRKALQSLVDSDTSLHDVIAERLEEKQQREAERQKALAKIQKANASDKSKSKLSSKTSS